MSTKRCRCGYTLADPAEEDVCARCGQQCCTQCAYMHPRSCAWYCHRCASEAFQVLSQAGPGYGRVYTRPHP